ncbi:hypothetical protein LSAT2_016963 [Lamellibrachia satsuma]|nr:hypothetical protein LSAT2_016963 [Lamellibrachia satsuma]
MIHRNVTETFDAKRAVYFTVLHQRSHAQSRVGCYQEPPWAGRAVAVMASVLSIVVLAVNIQVAATIVRGRTGASGDTGPTGSTGNTGLMGATGPWIGPKGAMGPPGSRGSMGSRGSQGFWGATGPMGADGPGGGKTGASGVTGPAGQKGGIGLTGPRGAVGKVPLAESHAVMTLELLWPAILTLLMSILTTFLAMRYRRVMNDLEIQRKNCPVELTSDARVKVAIQEPQLPESPETNHATMDANSMKDLAQPD